MGLTLRPASCSGESLRVMHSFSSWWGKPKVEEVCKPSFCLAVEEWGVGGVAQKPALPSTSAQTGRHS